MPHSTKLMDKIQGLVEMEYPPSEYRYERDQTLPFFVGEPAKGRQRSDLIIYNIRTGNVACVIEIGYTRPEKVVNYYDACEIPDIRWYSRVYQVGTSGRNVQPNKRYNCSIEVHPNNTHWKPELFCDHRILCDLGIEEGQSFITIWDETWESARLRLDPKTGRVWKRHSSKKGCPAGRARLRLKPLQGPPPKFQPVSVPATLERLQSGDIMLRLRDPLRRAPQKSINARNKNNKSQRGLF